MNLLFLFFYKKIENNCQNICVYKKLFVILQREKIIKYFNY